MEKIYTFITENNTEILCYMDSENNKWFNASIICEFLEYENIKNTLNLDHIKKYIQKYENIFKNNKLKTNTKIISEPGVYRLILNSTQKDALIIQDWLVEDVMPQLQKNKIYKLNSKNMQKYIK
jgi:prophage antirepressor-like protein